MATLLITDDCKSRRHEGHEVILYKETFVFFVTS